MRMMVIYQMDGARFPAWRTHPGEFVKMREAFFDGLLAIFRKAENEPEMDSEEQEKESAGEDKGVEVTLTKEEDLKVNFVEKGEKERDGESNGTDPTRVLPQSWGSLGS